MKHVVVVIVNWNGKKDTLECLESLGKSNCIVVDNGSTDGSVEEIRKTFPSVQIIENKENLGFSGGNNVGIKKALDGGADFVWLLNNDTRVDKNARQTLVDVFTDEGVGVAGSKIYFSPGHEFHKERYKKAQLGKVLWYAGGTIDWQNMYAAHRGVDEVDRGQYQIIEETPFISGCSLMVRRAVFEKVGLLDEKFFAYMEDLDFCLRAKRAGYKLLYVPQSIVWHKNAGSSGVGSQLHQYYMTRNRLLIGMRYAPLRTKIALLKEGVRFTSIRRRAYFDALLGRYGKQTI